MATNNRGILFTWEYVLHIPETFTKEPIGFALAFFNSWITVVQLAGWLDERHHYWFATGDWANQVQ